MDIMIRKTQYRHLGVVLAEAGYVVLPLTEEPDLGAYKIVKAMPGGAKELTVFLSIRNGEMFFQVNVCEEKQITHLPLEKQMEFKNQLLEVATYLKGVAIGRDTYSNPNNVMIVVTEKRDLEGLDVQELEAILNALQDGQEAVLTLVENALAGSK
ncbi:MAG: hypothetical protein HQK58_09935 [Deltaproteobacteria bacterium]|nr:hypothetical protein [Deltaproteobacteria bacterium]